MIVLYLGTLTRGWLGVTVKSLQSPGVEEVIMAKSRSCLMALPPRRRRELGVQDPERPVIRLEFTVLLRQEQDAQPGYGLNPEAQSVLVDVPKGSQLVFHQIALHESTEPDDWSYFILSAIPSWLCLRLLNRQVTVTYANADVRVYACGRRQHDDDAHLLAHYLTDVMLKAYDVKVNGIAQLPSYRKFRAELMQQCQASTDQLLTVGGFDRELAQARWLCRVMPPDIYGACSPRELAAAMQPINDMARSQRLGWLHLPVVGFATRWTDDDPYVRRADGLLDVVADSLLLRLMPRMLQRLGAWQPHDPDVMVARVRPLLPWQATTPNDSSECES